MGETGFGLRVPCRVRAIRHPLNAHNLTGLRERSTGLRREGCGERGTELVRLIIIMVSRGSIIIALIAPVLLEQIKQLLHVTKLTGSI